MIAEGAAVVETSALSNVVGLSVIRKGGMGDGDDLHPSVVKGGLEVATVVVITTLDG